jgi:AraC-like DNA-binding protein
MACSLRADAVATTTEYFWEINVDVSISLSDPRRLDATASCNKTAMPRRAAERQERQGAHGSRRISGPAAGFIVFDHKGRMVKADARAETALATVGVQLNRYPRLRVEALDTSGANASGARLPEWLDADWIEPVMEGDERLGTVVTIPEKMPERELTPQSGLPVYKLRRIADFIRARIDQPIHLEQLAAAAALSPFHFHRAFKRSTGMTPHQYIVHVRMERAKSLLSGSDTPLAEVAVQVGFADQSHFTAAFRRATAMTPRSYRNANTVS